MKKEKEDIRGHKTAVEDNRTTKKTELTFAFFPLFIIFLFFCLLLPSSAFSKEYDGIWFMGFNLTKPPFDNLKVRQAAAHTVAINEEVVPASIIPPGMPGYDPGLKPYRLNLKFAKTLMKQAGYPAGDWRLKEITLLHTNGVKTIETARKIRKDLKPLGMKIALIEVDYRDDEKWRRELASKKHSLFLMGYKAEMESLFTEEAASIIPDSASLLEPLFKSDGKYNFTGYNNPKVDALFEFSTLDREAKLKAVNRLLYKELPVLVLFYIERL